MTEANERIAALEANQIGLLKLAEKWDQMLVQVTQINTNLTNLITQSGEFSKNFGATLSAHSQRIGTVENDIAKLTEATAPVPKHGERLDSVERHLARGSTVWWTIVKIAIAVGSLAGFAASVVAVEAWVHR